MAEDTQSQNPAAEDTGSAGGASEAPAIDKLKARADELGQELDQLEKEAITSKARPAVVGGMPGT